MTRTACLGLALLLFGANALTAQTTTAPDSAVSEASVGQRPVPIPGSCRAPSYPMMLRAAQIQGQVLLQFVVDTAGRVDAASIQAVQSTHSHFTEAARRALATCRYTPARFDERAVRVLVRTTVTFALPRS